jgi:hypothetical protein
VLHDWVLPETEHRLAHVLAGPAGVVLVAGLPASGLVRERDGVLWTEDTPLADWFAVRWWEVDRLNAALARRLARWPWSGPVHPVAAVPEDRVSGVRRTGTGVAFPPVSDGVTVRRASQVRAWVATLPAPLPRLAAAELAAEVEALCPPAAVRDTGGWD